MSLDLSTYFDQFIANISLGDPQVPRMNSAAGSVMDFLQTSYGLPAQNFFIQGSFPNGTAVEPVAGGEYDLDIVAVCVGDNTACNSALIDLERRFKSDGRFKDRVKPKKPCVRLNYATDDVGDFHVDVVPLRMSPADDAPFDAPRRNEGWHGTAPAQYTQWCLQQGKQYQRTVKCMKRWRDEQQSVRTAIKSIVLQVLVSQCMPNLANDADRLAVTFRNLHNHLSPLSQPPVVANPVLPSENLAQRWTVESFRSFVTELAEAVAWAETACRSTDVVEAADAWRELLGNDFPVMSAEQLNFRVGDYSHAQTPAAMGWQEALDARYRVTIQATEQRGKRGQNRRPYPPNGRLIFAGNKLHFRAVVAAPNHVEVWWQVANTGGHARDRAQMRGGFFKGKDLADRASKDPRNNWENTQFTGSHLIRTLLVRNRVVVAVSDWFTVNIYSPSRSFRL